MENSKPSSTSSFDMSLFLRRLTLFLLPIALLAVGVETYVRHIPNSYRIKQQTMEKMADSTETVILGNSHAYSGIRPELLPGHAINLANVSQTTNLDLALLQRCIRHCPQLHDVIMVFDNSNLCDQPMEKTDEWFRITYYTLYMNRLGGHNPYLSRYGLELLHFQSLQGKIKHWQQQQHPDCTPLGWDTSNSFEARQALRTEASLTQDSTTWDSLQAVTKLARHHLQDEAVARLNINNVVEMARLCREHGIRFTLLCTPVRPDYDAGIPPKQQDLIWQTHHICHTRYGAITLDLSRDATFTALEYFDPDHLTQSGANHLTQILRSSLTIQ